jgi:hypothetical protein
VSVVRFRPWAPRAFPASFFLLRVRSLIGKNPPKKQAFALNKRSVRFAA